MSSYVLLALAGQMCGLPVTAVRDVLGAQKLTRIPLAPACIAGGLNLRGRIVTAIDLRRRLDLAAAPPEATPPSIVVEQDAEPYALIVDEVREVIDLADGDLQPVPSTLQPPWSEVCTGICQRQEGLIVALDVGRLLTITPDPPHRS